MNNFFLPYQEKWINDHSHLKIIEKSRQVGISWATAYHLVVNQSSSRIKQDAWISSRDSLQSKLLLDDCKSFANILNKAAKSLNRKILKPKSSHSRSLTFSNGCSIYALSSSVNSQAGKRGTRILDEFALHPDPHALYNTAFPGTTWGGSLQIISTHRTVNSFFNHLIRDILDNGNPHKFSYHRVTLQDALEQGLLPKIKSKLHPSDPRQAFSDADYFDYIRNSCADESSFLQEYMCVPMNESFSFLPFSLIESCEYPSHVSWQSDLSSLNHSQNPDSLFFLGIDIARKNDLSVFWLLELTPNKKLMTRHITSLHNKSFSEQEDVLHQYLSLKNLHRVCIDQTGIGLQFTERAQKNYPHIPVEGIHFTAPIKEKLAYPLRILFEQQQVFIPPSNEIRRDLHSIQRSISPSGNTRFHADRSKSGHADFFWALALSIHAALPSISLDPSSPLSTPHYLQIPRPSSPFFFQSLKLSL